MKTLNEMMGMEIPQPLAIIFLVLIFLVILLLIIWIVRKLLGGPRVSGGRNRQPRLAVTEAAVVDDKRRLVLVRRDNVEHLLMIGGPNDMMVEREIVRVRPALQPAVNQPPNDNTRPAQASGTAAKTAQSGPTGEDDKELAAILAGGVGGVVGGVKSGIAGVGTAIRDTGAKVADKSVEVGKSATSTASDVGKSGVKTVGKAAEKTTETLESAGHGIADTAGKAGSAVVDTASKAGSAVVDTASKAGSAVVDTASKAGSATVDTASKAGSTVADATQKTAAATTAAVASTAAVTGEKVASVTTSAGERLAETGASAAQTIKIATNGVGGNEADLSPPPEPEAPASPSNHEKNQTNGKEDVETVALKDDENLESVLSEGLDFDLDLDDDGISHAADSSENSEDIEDEMQRMLDELAGKS